jgi:hypothetical protein
MFKKILIRSGQFLLNTSNIELDADRFQCLVEDTLSIYNRFCPYDEHFFVTTSTNRRIILSPELVQSLTGKSYLATPDWVSDIHPSRLFGLNPYFIFKNMAPNSNPYLIDKTQMPWTYRKPELYVPMSAEWDVHGVWKHRIVETQSPTEGFIFDVPTLDEQDSDKFIKLLQAFFLQGIGRSRRAFTMNDLPITMDASDIAGEGITMEEQALDDLENVQKIYLAW